MPLCPWKKEGMTMSSSAPLARDNFVVDERANSTVRASPTPGELLLIAGLLWPESALLLALISDRLEMSQYLPLHLGACATTAALGLWWICRFSATEHPKSRTAMLLHATIWVLLAGPFGAFVAAALLLPRTASTSQGESLADQGAARHSELTRVEILHSSLLDRRLRLEQAHHIRPLLDVMIEGTKMEKLKALRLIAKRYVPEFATAARRALDDEDASVRVFAATVIAHQHNAHTKRIGALQTIATAAPECADNWLQLAQAHTEYAASGLLETSRIASETRQARTHMRRAARLAASVQPA